MELSPRHEPARREPLSDAEMGNLLSAFGNHEAKAITLIAMAVGTIYTQRDLHSRIMKLQRQRKGWRMNKSIPFGYCRNSLSPIGLVTKVLNPDLSTWGYAKTEYGERIGVPLAGLLLKFSYEHPERSIQDFFSQTQSPSKQVTTEDGTEAKKRAPITRLRMLQELVTSKLPIRITDLTREGGEDLRRISVHLENLDERGIISYDVNKYGESYSFYKLFSDHLQEQPPEYQNWPSLAAFVYQALLEHPDREWTRDSMADFYLEKTKKQIDKETLIAHIPGIFSHLQKTGYAERGKFSNKKHSEIDLTPVQKKVIVDLLIILDGFKNQDPEVIQEGRDFVNSLLSHPEAVSQLLLKAKEHSSQANQTTTEETEQIFLGILSSSQTSLSNKEIQRMLKERHGRRLSMHRISKLTHSLSQQSIISVSNEKGKRKIKKYRLLGIAAPDRM